MSFTRKERTGQGGHDFSSFDSLTRDPDTHTLQKAVLSGHLRNRCERRVWSRHRSSRFYTHQYTRMFHVGCSEDNLARLLLGGGRRREPTSPTTLFHDQSNPKHAGQTSGPNSRSSRLCASERSNDALTSKKGKDFQSSEFGSRKLGV